MELRELKGEELLHANEMVKDLVEMDITNLDAGVLKAQYFECDGILFNLFWTGEAEIQLGAIVMTKPTHELPYSGTFVSNEPAYWQDHLGEYTSLAEAEKAMLEYLESKAKEPKVYYYRKYEKFSELASDIKRFSDLTEEAINTKLADKDVLSLKVATSGRAPDTGYVRIIRNIWDHLDHLNELEDDLTISANDDLKCVADGTGATTENLKDLCLF